MATYIMKVMRHEGFSPVRLFAFCNDGARVVTLEGVEETALQRVGSVADSRSIADIEAGLLKRGYTDGGTYRVVDGVLDERLVVGKGLSQSGTVLLPSASVLLPLSEGWQTIVERAVTAFSSMEIENLGSGLRLKDGNKHLDIIARGARTSAASLLAAQTTPVLTLALVVIAEAFAAEVFGDDGERIGWTEVAESNAVRNCPDAMAAGRALGRFAPELQIQGGVRFKLFTSTVG